ncbi:Homocysteine S-methyltransferase [Panus rudis PR-1116 ss-1]|nr:Homocysteine S-methyltransferase [Panus rudis PR-1116 ss-1]
MFEKGPIRILDGGFVRSSSDFSLSSDPLYLSNHTQTFERTPQGTTLEDVFHKDISTPLWSAKPIDEDPETIIATHLAFLRAGARVILTATYQCAFETFYKAGYTHDEAVTLMRKAVHLAWEAKRRFLADQTSTSSSSTSSSSPTGNIAPAEISIALSLGPFGATLYPAQEFDGLYPPPYGPHGYAYDGTPPTQLADIANSFDKDDEREEEENAIRALEVFHLGRLKVFAEDEDTWDKIDIVAFETVPLTREVVAIRRAMTALAGSRKPFWISTVYPSGLFPERRASGAGSSREHVPVQEVFRALLGTCADDDRIGEDVIRPDGVGINCTRVEYLPDILRSVDPHLPASSASHKTFLCLYPNGGDTWEPVTKTWIPRSQTQAGTSADGEKTRTKSWAEQFGEIVLDVVKDIDKRWSGVIAGGCCKTLPDDIRELAGFLQVAGKKT